MSGIEEFAARLEELGVKTERRGDLVIATLDVGPPDIPGPHLVGTDPPTDFPNIPPHWLHLSRDLQLPGGGGKRSELGDGWLKWSRQHPKWRGGEHGVRHWLAHARSLLLTAHKN